MPARAYRPVDFARLHPRARRLREYLGPVVGAATLAPAGMVTRTGLACRRRPEHRRCDGRLTVSRQEVPPRIHWRCPECGDGGALTGWERSPWNLARLRWDAARDEELELRKVVLTLEQYDHLRREVLREARARGVASSARLDGAFVVLEAPLAWLEDLATWLAGEVERARGPRRRRLDRVCDRIERALVRPGALRDAT